MLNNKRRDENTLANTLRRAIASVFLLLGLSAGLFLNQRLTDKGIALETILSPLTAV